MLQFSLNVQIIKARSYSLKLFQRRKFQKNPRFQKKWSLHLWKVFQSGKCIHMQYPFILLLALLALQNVLFKQRKIFFFNNHSSLIHFLYFFVAFMVLVNECCFLCLSSIPCIIWIDIAYLCLFYICLLALISGKISDQSAES